MYRFFNWFVTFGFISRVAAAQSTRLGNLSENEGQTQKCDLSQIFLID